MTNPVIQHLQEILLNIHFNHIHTIVFHKHSTCLQFTFFFFFFWQRLQIQLSEESTCLAHLRPQSQSLVLQKQILAILTLQSKFSLDLMDYNVFFIWCGGSSHMLVQTSRHRNQQSLSPEEKSHFSLSFFFTYI